MQYKKHAILSILIFLIAFGSDVLAQGAAFGIKGGPVLALQRGEGAQSSIYVAYHGIAFIESLPAGNDHAVFAQAGYHQRGSARQRFNFRGFSSNSIIPNAYQFSNISLAAGVKQKFDWQGNKAFYMLGLRGEYTVDNNLDDFQNLTFSGTNGSSFRNLYVFPHPLGVNDWNFGFLLGGGAEFELGDLIGTVIELTVNPDITPQYFTPTTPNVLDQLTGMNVTVPERRFFNLSIELSVGIRLLRVIEYVD